MATADLSAFFAAINKQMTEQSAAFAADLFARLLGYENALIALIAALDRSGALPIAEAKSAIDAMAAGVSKDPLNAPQLDVLKRLADGPARAQAPPISRH